MAEFNIYDGMMPKIQALISPPDTASSKEKSGADCHPFLKRRGKRHNHDYCDACGEKGNVLCCEICPASFHLLCYDPPLSESDISNSQFLCRACKQTAKTNEYTSDKGSNQDSDERCSDFRITISSKSDKTVNGLHHGVSKVIHASESNSDNKRGTGTKSETSDQTITLKNSVTVYESNLCSKTYDSINERSQNQSKNTKNDRKKVEKISDVEIDDNTVVEDMWEIIGVNERTKITDCNKGEQNSQKDNVTGTRKRRIKETEKISPEKTFKNRDFNIKLPYCDYLLKEMNIPQEGKNSCSKIIVSSKMKTSMDKEDVEDSFGLKKTFKHIINEGKKTNPKQFVLPQKYTENIDLNLIASEKDPESFLNDLDTNDLLKLPTRKCYYCRGTCLTGQMISCDFCPAHFHLNCLTPPLCSIPEEKWMCPLHPHHILDKVMKNPSSLTELTTWWDELNAAVHMGEVESKFLRRIKALRKKRTRNTKKHGFVRIPDIVRYHYKHPMPQIPSLQELTNKTSECLFESDFILVPHDLIAKSNRCCEEIKSQNENEESKRRNGDKDQDNNNYNESTLIEISDDNQMIGIQSDVKNEDLSTWDEKTNEFKFKSCGIYNYDDLKVYEKPTLHNRRKSTKISQTLKVSHWQDYSENRFDQSSHIENDSSLEEIKSNVQRGEIMPPWKIIEGIVLRDVDYNFISDDSNEFGTARLESNLKRLLASGIINRVAHDLPPSFKPRTLPYPFFPPSLNNNSDLPEKPKAKVRAVLCPLSHRAPLVYMYDHTLSIGCDFSSDVCLLNYGHCNFISGEHAVIYYDSFTNAYELLNYSEYNTIVDGIIYTCDISSSRVDEENNLNAINNVKPTEKDSVEERKVDVMDTVAEESVEDFNETSSCTVSKLKKTSSIAGAAETRSIYKKLLHDINKLVSKSQEEMTSIAEEDLAEIAKASKNPFSLLVRLDESPSGKQKLKRKDSTTPVKRNKEKTNTKEDEIDSPKNNRSVAPVKVNDDSGFDSMNDCKIIEVSDESEKIRPKPKAKPKELTNVSEDLMDTVTVRRSQRRIKRSIFSTYRREMRKKKTANKILEEMDEELSEKDSEKEETKKLTAVDKDEEKGSDEEEQFSEDDHVSSDYFSISEGREKCRCQVNRVKLPNGRDETWEKAAPLYHGSYIRFGCIEFVFSIVGYPAPLEDRSYWKEKQLKETPCKNNVPELKTTNNNNEDLSSKLKSILNVLSARSESVSLQSSHSSRSTPSSSQSSRSSSPDATNDDGPCERVEISYENNETIKLEIEEFVD